MMKKFIFLVLITLCLPLNLAAQGATVPGVTPLEEALSLDKFTVEVFKNQIGKVKEFYGEDKEKLVEFYNEFIEALDENTIFVFPDEKLSGDNQKKTIDLYLAYFLLQNAEVKLDPYSKNFLDADVKIALMSSLFRDYVTATKEGNRLNVTTGEVPMRTLSYTLWTFFNAGSERFSFVTDAAFITKLKAEMRALFVAFGFAENFVETVLSGKGQGSGAIFTSRFSQNKTQQTGTNLSGASLSVFLGFKDIIKQAYTGDQKELYDFYLKFVENLNENTRFVMTDDEVKDENYKKVSDLYLAYFLIVNAGAALDFQVKDNLKRTVKMILMTSLFKEYTTVQREGNRISMRTENIPTQVVSYRISLLFNEIIMKYSTSINQTLIIAAREDLTKIFEGGNMDRDAIRKALETDKDASDKEEETTEEDKKAEEEKKKEEDKKSEEKETTTTLGDLFGGLGDGTKDDEEKEKEAREKEDTPVTEKTGDEKEGDAAKREEEKKRAEEEEERAEGDKKDSPVLEKESDKKEEDDEAAKREEEERKRAEEEEKERAEGDKKDSTVLEKDSDKKEEDDEAAKREEEEERKRADEEEKERVEGDKKDSPVAEKETEKKEEDDERAQGDVSDLIPSSVTTEPSFKPTFELPEGTTERDLTDDKDLLIEVAENDKFLKALRENEDYQSVRTGEVDGTLLPTLMEGVRYYAKTGSILVKDEAAGEVLEDSKGRKMNVMTAAILNAKSNANEEYGDAKMAWVTAGIPVSEENETPTVDAASKRCVSKIAETAIKDKDGKDILGEDGKPITLDIAFKDPADKYAVYSETRTDVDAGVKKEKVFCGAIITRKKEQKKMILEQFRSPQEPVPAEVTY